MTGLPSTSFLWVFQRNVDLGGADGSAAETFRKGGADDERDKNETRR